MSVQIKVEPRGKYAGVKIHLDGPQTELLIKFHQELGKAEKYGDFPTQELTEKVEQLVLGMAKSSATLLGKEPDLLKDRTPEQVASILAKEVEKASLQLQQVKAGKDWAKVDPNKLQNALLKHAK